MTTKALGDASIEQKLWHQMRADLARYIPQIGDRDVLMCCCCGRFLPQSDFDLEHIIPQSAVADDPLEVKQLFTVNERSKNLLLCKKPLQIKGTPLHRHGCNNWKGKHFDQRIREMMNGTLIAGNSHKSWDSRHNVAIMSLAYLALISRYGYQIALTPSGVLMRRQFFSPARVRPELAEWPWGVILTGEPFAYTQSNQAIWDNPFGFTPKEGKCVVAIRHLATYVPVSRNPNTPIASHVKYVPDRFTIKPNFRTIFDY
jgi:hypothetical protein